MSTSLDLGVAKKNLGETLGDEMKIYLHLLKSWFKNKLSREDFDHEARQMLPTDSVHLHNQFLLAIFIKCHTLGSSLTSRESSSSHVSQNSPTKSSSKKSKQKKRYVSSSSKSNYHRFVAVNPLLHAPVVHDPVPEPDDKGVGFASREMSLPDIGMVHGRMIVTAWDYGLEGVEDNAVKTLMKAVEMELKNILSVMFEHRVGYKLREKKFKYAMSTPLPESYLINTGLMHDFTQESEGTTVSFKGNHIPSIRPSVETGWRDAALQIACAGEMPPPKGPITLYDLFNALQVHKSAIPSHTVYATNMERIIYKLWHPTNEELEQEEIHKQEVLLKNELVSQQSLQISMRT